MIGGNRERTMAANTPRVRDTQPKRSIVSSFGHRHCVSAFGVRRLKRSSETIGLMWMVSEDRVPPTSRSQLVSISEASKTQLRKSTFSTQEDRWMNDANICSFQVEPSIQLRVRRFGRVRELKKVEWSVSWDDARRINEARFGRITGNPLGMLGLFMKVTSAYSRRGH